MILNSGSLNNANNSSDSGGNGSISGSTDTLGGSVTFDNLSWIVVDNGTRNSNEKVLALKDCWCICNGTDTYMMCDYFWNYVLSSTARAKCISHHINQFGPNAKTIPVFVPTYEEFFDTTYKFSYFTDDSKRIANYQGTAQIYWTSSPDSRTAFYFHSVNVKGGTARDYADDPRCFRPFISLKK